MYNRGREERMGEAVFFPTGICFFIEGFTKEVDEFQKVVLSLSGVCSKSNLLCFSGPSR